MQVLPLGIILAIKPKFVVGISRVKY